MPGTDTGEGPYLGKDRVHRIVANLLTSALSREDRVHGILSWERAALAWLAEEWERDPDLSWCGWAGDRVREYRGGEPILTGRGRFSVRK